MTLTSVWRIGNVLLSIHLMEEQDRMSMRGVSLRTACRSRSKHVRTKTHGSSEYHLVGLRDGDALNPHSELWSVLVGCIMAVCTWLYWPSSFILWYFLSVCISDI